MFEQPSFHSIVTLIHLSIVSSPLLQPILRTSLFDVRNVSVDFSEMQVSFECIDELDHLPRCNDTLSLSSRRTLSPLVHVSPLDHSISTTTLSTPPSPSSVVVTVAFSSVRDAELYFSLVESRSTTAKAIQQSRLAEQAQLMIMMAPLVSLHSNHSHTAAPSVSVTPAVSTLGTPFPGRPLRPSDLDARDLAEWSQQPSSWFSTSWSPSKELGIGGAGGGGGGSVSPATALHLPPSSDSHKRASGDSRASSQRAMPLSPAASSALLLDVPGSTLSKRLSPTQRGISVARSPSSVDEPPQRAASRESSEPQNPLLRFDGGTVRDAAPPSSSVAAAPPPLSRQEQQKADYLRYRQEKRQQDFERLLAAHRLEAAAHVDHHPTDDTQSGTEAAGVAAAAVRSAIAIVNEEEPVVAGATPIAPHSRQEGAGNVGSTDLITTAGSSSERQQQQAADRLALLVASDLAQSEQFWRSRSGSKILRWISTSSFPRLIIRRAAFICESEACQAVLATQCAPTDGCPLPRSPLWSTTEDLIYRVDSNASLCGVCHGNLPATPTVQIEGYRVLDSGCTLLVDVADGSSFDPLLAALSTALPSATPALTTSSASSSPLRSVAPQELYWLQTHRCNDALVEHLHALFTSDRRSSSSEGALHTLLFWNCLSLTDRSGEVLCRWLQESLAPQTRNVGLRRVIFHGAMCPLSKKCYDQIQSLCVDNFVKQSVA